MYDTVKFVLTEEELDNKICFLEEVGSRITITSHSERRVLGHIKNMKVEIKGTVLLVVGSLTKWFLGNNCERYLKLHEVRFVIRTLSRALGVPIEKAKVKRMDVAFNFKVDKSPWVYMTKLLYSNGYHRSNIKKETLYFDKHDLQLVFYDKKREMCNDKNKDEELYEVFEGMNILRYECRFRKVTSIFKGIVRGEQLYEQSFCLLVLDKWYDCYEKIQKGYDEDFCSFRFDSKKNFELSCVAYCSAKLNFYDMLEEAFACRYIDSKNKYDIKEVLKKADEQMKEVANGSPLIDELTKKIRGAYAMFKRQYNISPDRMRVINKFFDKGL